MRLSTYHLAKGLEWEVVFMPGLRDGELPFWRAKKPAEIAEQRRLFYVGITRAKSILELSTAGIAHPSRFLDELLLAPATPAVPAPRRSGGKKSKKRPPWSASSSSSSPSDGPRLSPNSWLPDWMREND